LRKEILLLPPSLINHSHGGEIVNDHMTNISGATDACVNPQSVQEQTAENSRQNEAVAAKNSVQNEAANTTRGEAGIESGGDLPIASGRPPQCLARPGVIKRMEQTHPQDLLQLLHPDIKLYNYLLPLHMLLHQQIFDHRHVCKMAFARARYTLTALSIMAALLLLLESHRILVKSCLI
jgi:hypothetical protein